jgi:plastocyanin
MSKKSLRTLLLLLTLFAIGSVVLAACTRPGTPVASGGTPGSSGNGNNGGGPPAVHMGPTNFVQSTVTISKGATLQLIDDGQYTHILSNGTWVNGVAKPAKEPGAPTVNNLQINGNNAQIGPFNTAGLFHIYCSIHPGMNLDVTVK